MKPAVKYLATSVLFVLLVATALYLYYDKKDSADGRLFVWRISLSMVQEKPIAGYGYGFFDKHYNLKQSDYFQTNVATKAELQNARYVYMPYNDYLENFVYGGIIGLVFFLFFLIMPIRYAQKQSDPTAFAVLLAVAVMGMTNFIFQSVPVWIVALVMIAYSVARADLGQIRVSGAKFVYVLLVCTVLAFGVSLKQGYGKVMLASALEHIKNKNPEGAHLAFERGAWFAGSDGVFYLRCMAGICFKKGTSKKLRISSWLPKNTVPISEFLLIWRFVILWRAIFGRQSGIYSSLNIWCRLIS
jgi:hypothetical protein